MNSPPTLLMGYGTFYFFKAHFDVMHSHTDDDVVTVYKCRVQSN